VTGVEDLDVEGSVVEAESLLARCKSVADVNVVEAELIGKRSRLAEVNRELRGLPPDVRRERGRRLHEVRGRIESLLVARREELRAASRQTRLESDRIDLSEVMSFPLDRGGRPGGRMGPPAPARGHPGVVQRTRDELEDVFVGMGFIVVEGPEVETDWYNFEALNIPPAHPARGMWDTFYLRLGDPETVLLRTHTSPVQIRLMQAQRPPIYAVVPGRCYRRDTPDARHVPIFHQIEGLVIDRGISFSDLAGTIDAFTTAYFGEGIHARLRPAFFPFTEPSAEFEITCTICAGVGCRTCSQTGWIELGGCGMVDPAVLGAVGIDDEEWSGFAFGFGIDRCAQMRHGIPDMRVLLENDARFLRQL
jgi:phenylalanyl-tRNA synthetase alpha chain